MKTRISVFTAAAFAFLLTGCVPIAAPTTVAPSSAPPLAPLTQSLVTPAEIVMGAAERYNAGDLAGAMAYWADDAIFYMFGMPPTGSELAAGREQIEAVFEENIANHAKWEVEIGSIVGDVVNTRSKNWHDFTRQIGVAPLESSGVFVIQDDKIASYTWILNADSASNLKNALSEVMPAEPEAATPNEPPMSELTVTISDGTCSYEGPLALRAGEVQVTVDVLDQSKVAYAVTFLTLDSGKDFMDLMASTMGAPPAWSKLLPYREVGPGQNETYGITVLEGPLYAICWSKPPDLPIGNIGPFAVSD